MKHKFIWLQSLPVLLGIICSISIVLAIYQLQHQFQKPLHVKKIVQQLTMIQPLLPLLAPITGQLHQEPEFKEEKIEGVRRRWANWGRMWRHGRVGRLRFGCATDRSWPAMAAVLCFGMAVRSKINWKMGCKFYWQILRPCASAIR